MAFAKVYIRSGEQCLFRIDPNNPPAPFFFWSRWVDIFVDCEFPCFQSFTLGNLMLFLFFAHAQHRSGARASNLSNY